MCKYCEAERGYELLNPYGESGCASLQFKGNKFIVSYEDSYEFVDDEMKINYCPMCGRKLGESNGSD